MPPPGRWRAIALLCLLGSMTLAVAARLVELQGLRYHEFIQQVVRQRSAREPWLPRPGDILDRQGRVFATTVLSRSLFVIPARIEDPWKLAQRLAAALQMDADALFEKLASHPERQFLWVKRRLSLEEVEAVRKLDLPPEVYGFRDEYLRRYPQGNLAAQVLGLRDIDGNGKGGIEQQFNQELAGNPGWRELVRDARGRVIDVQPLAETAPQPGRSITLTLDAVIQLYTERALDEVMKEFRPLACCAIVMAAESGEVLALASRPTFDPNVPQSIPDAAWRNRPVSDIYEPGSTFKPFVVAWALQQGLLKPDEIFDCENGEYRMGSRLLHDHHRYGNLNVIDILVKSSNIGMAKIGERLGNEQLHAAAQAFGFGRRTGIELPGELSGVVRPLAEWTSYSTGSVPMGQEISVTPLQVITAFSVLANHGRQIAPRIVRQIGQDQEQPPVLASEVIRADVADWVTRKALTEVVKRGTGRRAQPKFFEIFGKTGTAQKMDPVRGGYSADKNFSTFVCGGPADHPQILVLLSVDEPTEGGDGHGGTVAAPAAAEILEKALIQWGVSPNRGTIRSALEAGGNPGR